MNGDYAVLDTSGAVRKGGLFLICVIVFWAWSETALAWKLLTPEKEAVLSCSRITKSIFVGNDSPKKGYAAIWQTGGHLGIGIHFYPTTHDRAPIILGQHTWGWRVIRQTITDLWIRNLYVQGWVRTGIFENYPYSDHAWATAWTDFVTTYNNPRLVRSLYALFQSAQLKERRYSEDACKSGEYASWRYPWRMLGACLVVFGFLLCAISGDFDITGRSTSVVIGTWLVGCIALGAGLTIFFS